MKLLNILWCGTLVALCITGCRKDVNYDADTIDADLSLTLKGAAPFPLGVGVGYEEFIAGGKYADIIKSEFSNVTAGYVMKHGAIVQNGGIYNFAKADDFVNKATTAGLDV